MNANDIKVGRVKVKSLLTKSNLPASDFVINPYVGCPHGCKYCYACFMKRFTGHDEEWGTFVDIKECNAKINIQKLKGKMVFIASVTDCYNAVEREACVTRKVLEQIVEADCQVQISTKSSLILRDLDILKRFKNLTVAMSINTLDENFCADMDNASPIKERLRTLRTLHENGIRTVCFVSPMFPKITDFREIVRAAKDFVDEFWFENLNLRGKYKFTILNYIQNKHPELFDLYRQIYDFGNLTYWEEISKQIEEFCVAEKVNFKNFFYHDKIKKNSKKG